MPHSSKRYTSIVDGITAKNTKACATFLCFHVLNSNLTAAEQKEFLARSKPIVEMKLSQMMDAMEKSQNKKEKRKEIRENKFAITTIIKSNGF